LGRVWRGEDGRGVGRDDKRMKEREMGDMEWVLKGEGGWERWGKR
jgi:hypothetical protein